MKKLLLCLLVITLTASCRSQEKKKEEEKEEKEKADKAELEKKISKRDYSIKAANAYSNLFLDSMAMEKFIADSSISDSVKRRMRSFYNVRNFQFAWFSSDGITEQGRSFWNLHEYYTTYSDDNSLDDKKLKKQMSYMVSADTLKLSPNKTLVGIELTLTEHFIQYILKNYPGGEIKRKEMERFVPYKKENAMELADSLLTKKHKDNKYYADVNEAYKLLQQQLQKYYDITKKGGWPMVTMTEKKLKPGMSSPTVLALKQRLQVTGEMPAGDTSMVFDDALGQAVKLYQQSRGLTPTGVVTRDLVKGMNVPAIKCVQLILLNMGRMRWMLNHEDGDFIMVNIPEFVLHVFEGKKRVFDMPVVVGKEGHNTMMFTGNLNQVVFSPYWGVPTKIVREEILPAMQRDPSYLERNNMEIYDQPIDGIPQIRQLPGPKNSLGLVKFLFPNSYDIYFHDTPAKDLFTADKRAYSHGCIRLSDPFKMATYVLRNQKEWTSEKISQAMNSGVEQYVKVKKPIPVLITYYTAWVDENGMLNFRDDIYRHDGSLMKKMFLQ